MDICQRLDQILYCRHAINDGKNCASTVLKAQAFYLGQEEYRALLLSPFTQLQFDKPLTWASVPVFEVGAESHLTALYVGSSS